MATFQESGKSHVQAQSQSCKKVCFTPGKHLPYQFNSTLEFITLVAVINSIPTYLVFSLEQMFEV